MDNNNICGIIAIILIFMIIHIIGYENLPKHVQSALAEVSRKIKRLRMQNPIITLIYVHTSGEEQRQNAVLDWLNR